jgi:hypothetical protein
MNGSFLFRELLLAIFIIVLIFWIWRWMRGTAGSWRGWVTTLVAILLLSLFAPWMWQKISEGGITVTSSGIQTTHPTEEWIFVWHLPPNQYDRGRNGDTLEARIVKNDSKSLWFDTIYNYDGSMEVGRTQLSKNGDRFVGSWSQDNPMDGGSIYMDKVDNQIWVGQFTDQTGRTYPCTLKRK